MRLFRPSSGEFMEIPLVKSYAENSRGIGISDMADAIRNGKKPRAGVDLMIHVLEVTNAFEESSDSKRHIDITSKIERPAPLGYTEIEGVLAD